MNIIKNISFIVFGVFVGLFAEYALIIQYGLRELPNRLQVFGIIAVAFGTTIAFIVFLYNAKRHRKEDIRKESETYLKESLSLLNKVHETFINHGDSPPKNDRLLWLTVARMIVRFQKMRDKISEHDHLVVADENEEYVRFKFYDLLDRNKVNFTEEYFSGDGDIGSITPISIAVIFEFSRWKKGMEDPLHDFDSVEMIASGAIPIDQLGVEQFLMKRQSFYQKIEARKIEIRANKCKPSS